MAIEVNRLFFALWPDPPVRAACAEAARSLRLKMQAEGRVTEAAKLHITLLFLGHTLSAEQEAVARQAASLIRSPPFTLRLEQAGCFRKRQIVWWLGARETPPALATLYRRLHDLMLEARMPTDRQRFVPHLTILRDARRPLPQSAIEPIVWPLRDFVLVRSRLDRQPAEYEVIGRWPLEEESRQSGAASQLKLWENDLSR